MVTMLQASNSSTHFQTDKLSLTCYLLPHFGLGSSVGKQGVEAVILACKPYRGSEYTPR